MQKSNISKICIMCIYIYTNIQDYFTLIFMEASMLLINFHDTCRTFTDIL